MGTKFDPDPARGMQTQSRDISEAAELSEAGYEQTVMQCRDKIKELKGEYRKVKYKRNNMAEGEYSEWDYFNALDAILGHRPATKVPVVVNSLDDAQEEQEDFPLHLILLMIRLQNSLALFLCPLQ